MVRVVNSPFISYNYVMNNKEINYEFEFNFHLNLFKLKTKKLIII